MLHYKKKGSEKMINVRELKLKKIFNLKEYLTEKVQQDKEYREFVRKSLREAEEDIEAGRYYTYEELVKEFEQDVKEFEMMQNE